jgi:hypothetical protein
MGHEIIQNLLADVQSSLQDFASDGAEASRKEALERVLKLAREIERPRDAILKLGFSVQQSNPDKIVWIFQTNHANLTSADCCHGCQGSY